MFVFFCPRIQARDHTTLNDLRPAHLWRFLRLSLLSSPLDSFEEYWSSILQKCPLVWVCLIFVFSPALDWGYGLWGLGEEYHRSDIPFSSHRVTLCMTTAWLIPDLLTIITWGWCLLGFCAVTLLFPEPYSPVAASSRRRDLSSPSPVTELLLFGIPCKGDLSLPRPPLIY